MADPIKKDEVTEAPSFLEMSDEEIMNLPDPGAVAASIPEEHAPEVVVPETPAVVPAEVAPVVEAVAPVEAVKTEAVETAKPEGETVPRPGTVSTEAGADETVAKVEEKKEEAPSINYETEYKKLLTPFKANGRDIQVESVDDAIALMQMGANYSKKMAALKPNLKLLKMLENNKLLSEEKLGFLIDLDKKDPGAINKLVKDSGIDPMDLSAEKAGSYKQTAYAVADEELDLDAVLGEIQDSPTYSKTLDVVGNKWDTASKQVVAKTPQLLKIINDHVATGIYDLINTEVERERVFGRLKGMSDIEAYKAVGDSIQGRGGFNHLFNPQSQEQKTTPAAPEIVAPKPKVEDATLNDKRRAAGSPQTAAPSATPAEFNPLNLSDDEFSKIAARAR